MDVLVDLLTFYVDIMAYIAIVTVLVLYRERGEGFEPHEYTLYGWFGSGQVVFCSGFKNYRRIFIWVLLLAFFFLFRRISDSTQRITELHWLFSEVGAETYVRTCRICTSVRYLGGNIKTAELFNFLSNNLLHTSYKTSTSLSCIWFNAISLCRAETLHRDTLKKMELVCQLSSINWY